MTNNLYSRIPSELATDQRICDGAFRLYAFILKQGYFGIELSYEDIAYALDKSLRSVGRYVKELEEAGWLQVGRTGRESIYTCKTRCYESSQ